MGEIRLHAVGEDGSSLPPDQPAQIIAVRDYPKRYKGADNVYRLVIYRGPKEDKKKWMGYEILFLSTSELERTYDAIGKVLGK